MKDGKLVVYWDSVIYITILAGDKKDKALYEGSIYALTQMEKRNSFLVVSQLVNIEVTPTIRPPKIKEKFENVLKRSNVTLVSMGKRVSELASQIIDICKDMDRVIKPPDSIHLATALIYNVDEFYTNDDKLLKLDGILKVPKYNVPKIIKPPLPTQLTLGLQ